MLHNCFSSLGRTKPEVAVTVQVRVCVTHYCMAQRVTMFFTVTARLSLESWSLFRCMLESRGLTVRSIPFYEWNSLQSIDQQRLYLSRLLASAYALTYA